MASRRTAEGRTDAWLRKARGHPLLSWEDEVAIAQEMDAARAEIVRRAGRVPGVAEAYLAMLCEQRDTPPRRGRVYLGTTTPEQPPAEDAEQPPIDALQEMLASGDSEAVAQALAPVRPSEDVVERWADEVRTSTLPAEDKRAVARACRRLATARNRLAEHNLRLVISLAKAQKRPEGWDFADLVGDGHMGLLIAVRAWRYKMGHRFSTYATWWIRQAVSRSVQERSRTVRAPTASRQRRERLANGEPTPADRLAQAAMAPALSMDAPLKGNPHSTLHDVLPGGPPPEAGLSGTSVQYAAVNRALDKMDPRLAEIIRRRYGIAGGPPASLRALGEELGLSKKAMAREAQCALAALRREVKEGVG